MTINPSVSDGAGKDSVLKRTMSKTSSRLGVERQIYSYFVIRKGGQVFGVASALYISREQGET